MTHNERVLELLADGEPHTHLELYSLHVIAHSRVADLRKRGHTIECWAADGLHWYQLLDGRDGLTAPSPAPAVEGMLSEGGRDESRISPPTPAFAEQPDGQLSLVAA